MHEQALLPPDDVQLEVGLGTSGRPSKVLRIRIPEKPLVALSATSKPPPRRIRASLGSGFPRVSYTM